MGSTGVTGECASSNSFTRLILDKKEGANIGNGLAFSSCLEAQGDLCCPVFQKITAALNSPSDTWLSLTNNTQMKLLSH